MAGVTPSDRAIVQAVAELGVAAASASPAAIAEDTAVKLLEIGTAAIRQAADPSQRWLEEFLSEWERLKPAVTPAIGDYRAGLDLGAAPIDDAARWYAPPTRPALMARKAAVVPCAVGLRQAASHEEAARQNGQFIRWEVPNAAEAARAERVFAAVESQRIEVRVVRPSPFAPMDPPKALALSFALLEDADEDEVNPDFAVELLEAAFATIYVPDRTERVEINRSLRAALTGLDDRASQALLSLIDQLDVED